MPLESIEKLGKRSGEKDDNINGDKVVKEP
jgi:hypothetical protein